MNVKIANSLCQRTRFARKHRFKYVPVGSIDNKLNMTDSVPISESKKIDMGEMSYKMP